MRGAYAAALLLLFLAHQAAAATGVSPAWADARLDDLLFLPLVFRLLIDRPRPAAAAA